MPVRTPLVSLLAASIAASAHAGTYVVDDTPGPGVDFSQISTAIAAAQAGDILLVNAGLYLPFTLDKGLVLLGNGSGAGVNTARVDGEMRIAHVPAHERAVVSKILPDRFVVEGCSGTVLLERFYCTRARITRSQDVRLWKVHVYGKYGYSETGTSVAGARVEWLDSLLSGGKGHHGSVTVPTTPVGNGGIGLEIGNEAQVHLGETNVVGGGGGGATQPTHFGGDAGIGIEVAPNAGLFLTGGYLTLTGGDGGHGPFWPSGCLQSGIGASGIVTLGGSVRIGTGNSPASGGVGDVSANCNAPVYAPAIQGTNVFVPPTADPTFGMNPAPAPGGSSYLSVGPAEPGESIVIKLSRRTHVVSTPGVVVDDLVPADWVIPIPTSGFGGWAILSHTWPANLPAGTVFFAQAELTSAAGVRRTNSFPIVMR